MQSSLSTTQHTVHCFMYIGTYVIYRTGFVTWSPGSIRGLRTIVFSSFEM